MYRILIGLVCVSIVAGLMFFAINKSYQLKEEKDFVILADKVGNPTLMTIFRADPNGHENKDPNYCSVGGDKLYTPWNVSVFTAANVGDVLRRYHYTNSYRIFGKTILQDCYDAFLPVKMVSLYPDMNFWPFKKGSLAKNAPYPKDAPDATNESNNVFMGYNLSEFNSSHNLYACCVACFSEIY